MSDDEADPELLQLLRESLGLTTHASDEIPSDTGVLKDAEFVYNNAIDVSIDMRGTKAASQSIYAAMQQRDYSTHTWGQHHLHPTPDQGFSDVDIVNFVFTLDLLNFSFWSELSEEERFQVEYRGKRWTGYRSLLAALRRALDENIQVTTPRFWTSAECSDDLLKHVFRSATAEQMPLLDQRIHILRETGQILAKISSDNEAEPTSENASHDPGANEDETLPRIGQENGLANATPDTPEVEGIAAPDATVAVQHSIDPEANEDGRADTCVLGVIAQARKSAARLVNLLVKQFPSFRDETSFGGRRVRLYKRAQIFVADLWAALNNTGYGEFYDVDHLTMFADYRIPQMLHSLGVLAYSPALEYSIRDRIKIAPGSSWEVQLRGCSIWAVDLLRRQILLQHPQATGVNAVLIDFLLYDLAKERESAASLAQPIVPHHLTRSEFY